VNQPSGLAAEALLDLGELTVSSGTALATETMAAPRR
jgi:hypothetical protein